MKMPPAGERILSSPPEAFYLSYFILFLLQSLQQLFSLCFKSRFSKECEHIFLIALNSRLIEWIHTEQISADSTCEFEEVE